MKADPRYRLLLALFGLSVACALMADSRWLTGGLSTVWTACCQSLETVVGREMAARLAIFTHTALIALSAFGAGVLLLRLWKTHRFVSGLNAAAVAVPSMRLARLFADLGLSRHVGVLATEVPLAFCFGLLRPRICLTTGLADALTDKELKAVLLHEDHHRRHYDPLRGLLVQVFGTMLFFLPVAAELRDLFLTSTELEADRHAARLAGRPSLAGAMHKILTYPLATRLPNAVGISGLDATDARIAQLLGDSPPVLRLSVHSLISSSTILILVCALTLM